MPVIDFGTVVGEVIWTNEYVFHFRQERFVPAKLN